MICPKCWMTTNTSRHYNCISLIVYRSPHLSHHHCHHYPMAQLMTVLGTQREQGAVCGSQTVFRQA